MPPKAEEGKELPSISLAPGDFTTLYAPSGLCHRRFDAVLTCFFMDTLVDLAEFVGLLSCMLAPGGVWVNVGPLHFHDEAKLKLSWEEISGMVEKAGFEFKEQRMITCDYHLPWGVKMFSESYCCVLAVAVRTARDHDVASDGQAVFANTSSVGGGAPEPAEPLRPVKVKLPNGQVVSLKALPPQAEVHHFVSMVSKLLPPPEDSRYVLQSDGAVLADTDKLQGTDFTVLAVPAEAVRPAEAAEAPRRTEVADPASRPASTGFEADAEGAPQSGPQKLSKAQKRRAAAEAKAKAAAEVADAKAAA